MTGAALSEVGGVLGRLFVSIEYGALEILGRSGGCTSTVGVCTVGVCRSVNMDPNLDDTLPRLLTAVPVSFSLRTAGDALGFRSGL